MKRLVCLFLSLYCIFTLLAQGHLEFNTMTVDFGLITQEKPVTAVFVYKNTGNEPITIKGVGVTTVKVVPKYSREMIQPNETGKIEVTYDVLDALSGSFRKTIIVTTSNEGERIKLVIKGEISEEPPARQNRNTWIRVYKNGKYGAEDLNGKILIPIEYSDISFFCNTGKTASGFLVQKGINIGFYNVNGKKIIPTEREYKNIYKETSKEFGTYYVYQKDGYAGFCNVSGKEVLSIPTKRNVEPSLSVNDYKFTPFYKNGKFFIIESKYVSTGGLFEIGPGGFFYKIIDGNGKVITGGGPIWDMKDFIENYTYDDSLDIKTTRNPLVNNPIE